MDTQKRRAEFERWWNEDLNKRTYHHIINSPPGFDKRDKCFNLWQDIDIPDMNPQSRVYQDIVSKFSVALDILCREDLSKKEEVMRWTTTIFKDPG